MQLIIAALVAVLILYINRNYHFQKGIYFGGWG